MKTKEESNPRRMSIRQFFIYSYVKNNIYRDFTPFEMKRESINDVANLAAQITWKLIQQGQLTIVEKQYKQMTDEQLEYLKNL